MNLNAHAMTAQDVIDHFGLSRHPREGGFFLRTYESSQNIGGRALSSAILYLITDQSFSQDHRVDADELWHFYAGDPAEQTQTHSDGSSHRFLLGTDFSSGQRPQLLVPMGIWQSTRLLPGGRWALFGATVCPGFVYSGYEERKTSTRLAP